MLQRAPDPRKAEEYIVSRLDLGGSISRHVRRRFSTWAGRAFIIAEEDVKDSVPESYKHGGLDSRGGSVERLATLLHVECAIHRQWIVFEHSLAGPNDPVLEKFSKRPIIVEGSAYVVADEPEILVSAIKDYIHDTANALSFCAIVCQLPVISFNSESGIEDFCDRASSIVVDAFDGESFLFWHRDH
jgi:hypothetical protein